MLHLSRVITIQDRRKRSWKEAMKLEHRTPGYKAYPQSSTVEPSLLSHFLGEQYFNYQVKCGQGYSGRLVFPAGGGTPEWKEFRPLSAFTKGETY